MSTTPFPVPLAGAKALDEIPGAYKDIDQVIAAQSDLVEVTARLHTLMCVKG